MGDCTGSGKDLCEKHGVKGFPTIKWGHPLALEDYDGGRTYEELKKFALENIKPICSPANLDLCDEEKKKEITSLMKLSASELSEQIAAKEKAIEDAEAEFKKHVDELQAAYQKAEDEKTEK